MRFQGVPNLLSVVQIIVTFVPELNVARIGWLVPACFRILEDARILAAREAHLVRAVRILENTPVFLPE